VYRGKIKAAVKKSVKIWERFWGLLRVYTLPLVESQGENAKFLGVQRGEE
jgi:hypothetical protein